MVVVCAVYNVEEMWRACGWRKRMGLIGFKTSFYFMQPEGRSEFVCLFESSSVDAVFFCFVYTSTLLLNVIRQYTVVRACLCHI